MSKFSLAVMAAVLVAGVAAVRGEEEATGSTVTIGTDVSSAYVFRGVTLNDGVVVQPYAEIGGLPITFGVWANLDVDDYDGALDKGQFSEVDLYASYSLPIEAVDISFGYTEYLYMSGADADREVTATLGLSSIPLSPSIMVAYGLDGAIKKSMYVEAGLTQEFALSDDLALSLSGAIGYVSPDEGDDGFAQFSAGAGVSYKILSASVTYVGQVDDEILVDVEDGGLYDVEVYGTVGLSYEF